MDYDIQPGKHVRLKMNYQFELAEKFKHPKNRYGIIKNIDGSSILVQFYERIYLGGSTKFEYNQIKCKHNYCVWLSRTDVEKDFRCIMMDVLKKKEKNAHTTK